MTTAVDGKTYTTATATNSPAFYLKGGYYMVTAQFTSAGSVELQALAPDGSTWMSLPTALKLTTTATMIAGYAPPGQYRFTVTTVTSVTAVVTGVPIS